MNDRKLYICVIDVHLTLLIDMLILNHILAFLSYLEASD